NTATAPARFILRDATGISNLGFNAPYVTDDIGASGNAIRIDPTSGTLQATPDLHHATGVMAHEFGHLLGLPDLFDTQWTDNPSGPERDSAGIGRWGLMGWGALGWDDAPGPTAFSAWSRLRLGWAQVSVIEGRETAVELTPVASSGQLSQILLSGNEYFLVEHRTRGASYYDRGIPADGLLIWHVRRAEVEGELSPWWDVDLECADGLWSDAGFPIGAVSDSQRGEDNLDFWAHDVDYLQRHVGNHGDATDPFDGSRFRRFTSATNPAAVSSDGVNDITIDQISGDADRMSFVVRNNPPDLELSDVAPRGPRVTAGTPMEITFHLTNVGGTPANDLRAVLMTDDETAEILNPDLELFPLAAGRRSLGPGGPDGFPKIRFPSDLTEDHTATIELVILANGLEVARTSMQITGVPGHRFVVAVTDDEQSPLPGVRVSLDSPVGVQSLFFEHLVLTDSVGVAEFYVPTGTYNVEVQPDGDSPWAREQVGVIRIVDEHHIDVSLSRTYELSGVVRNAEGQPVDTHYLILWRNDGGNRFGTSLATDNEGRYITRLAAGTYEINTRALSGGSAVQIHGLVEISGDTQFDLELEAGVRVTVEVIDEQGNSIDRVGLFARLASELNTSANARTRGGAGAQFELPRGSYEVLFYDVPAPFVVPQQNATLDVSGDTTIVVTLQSGALVKVQLTDDDGRLIQAPPNSDGSISIALFNESGFHSTNMETQSTEVELGVLPGTYAVQLNAFSSGGADLGFPQQQLDSVSIGSDTTLTLSVDPGVLVDGRILGYQGGTNSFDRISFASSVGSASSRLDADGSFLARVFPGEYTAQVSFNGDGSGPSQTLGLINVRTDTTAVWSLLDDEAIHGVVTDGSEPISGLNIFAVGRTGDRSVYNFTTTRNDGSFDLRLADGTYVVQGSLGGIGHSVSWRLPDITVPVLVPPTLILPGGATVTTQITGANDLIQAGRVGMYPGSFSLSNYLDLILNSGPAIDIRIDAARAVDFDMAPGPYFALTSDLSFSSPSYYQVHSEFIPDGASALDVKLPGPEGTIHLTGRLTNSDGDPLERGTLLAFETHRGLLVQANVTGEYDFPLPAGSYQIALAEWTTDGARLAYMGGPIEVTQDRVFNIALGVDTAIDQDDSSPHRFALEQNYPNPFNAQTIIEFSIDVVGRGELVLFDMLGRRVRTLLDAQLVAGPHRLQWDGRDDEGRAAATGIYFYRLTTPTRMLARKLMLIR
ncbi:MAG: T9SS type A sorting domain-containing protein, partial [Gemmatimonadetes bacterium]|nr:T9SS type A sorting domain-containing protein [Gemmatimonadota bacterium]